MPSSWRDEPEVPACHIPSRGEVLGCEPTIQALPCSNSPHLHASRARERAKQGVGDRRDHRLYDSAGLGLFTTVGLSRVLAPRSSDTHTLTVHQEPDFAGEKGPISGQISDAHVNHWRATLAHPIPKIHGERFVAASASQWWSVCDDEVKPRETVCEAVDPDRRGPDRAVRYHRSRSSLPSCGTRGKQSKDYKEGRPRTQMDEHRSTSLPRISAAHHGRALTLQAAALGSESPLVTSIRVAEQLRFFPMTCRTVSPVWRWAQGP